MPMDLFSSNVQQEIDEGHSDKKFNNLKITPVLTLDSCDIKPEK